MPEGRFLVTATTRMNIPKMIRETRMEMKHVVWPSRTQALTYAAVVILLSIGLGYLLAGFDELFRIGLKTLLVK